MLPEARLAAVSNASSQHLKRLSDGSEPNLTAAHGSRWKQCLFLPAPLIFEIMPTLHIEGYARPPNPLI